jgi:hypothetical protein
MACAQGTRDSGRPLQQRQDTLDGFNPMFNILEP